MPNFANSQDGCFGTGCFCTRLQKRMFRHNVPKLFLAETSGSRLDKVMELNRR